MRPLATGIWLQNITDMHVHFYDEMGSIIATFTKDTPGHLNPIVDIDLDLDGLGLCMKARVNMSQRYFQPPYSLEVRVDLIDEIHGVVPLFAAFQEVIELTANTRETGIELRPLEDLELQNEYSGFPLSIAGVTQGSFNISSMSTYFKTEEGKSYTNQDVLSELSKRDPQLTFGVDGELRFIMGLPSDGVPVIIPTSEVISLVPNNHVINPYSTSVKSTAEKGWRSYSRSRSVGRLTPRIFKDIGAPKTKEVTVNSGGPSISATIMTYKIQSTAGFVGN